MLSDLFLRLQLLDHLSEQVLPVLRPSARSYAFVDWYIGCRLRGGRSCFLLAMCVVVERLQVCLRASVFASFIAQQQIPVLSRYPCLASPSIVALTYICVSLTNFWLFVVSFAFHRNTFVSTTTTGIQTETWLKAEVHSCFSLTYDQPIRAHVLQGPNRHAYVVARRASVRTAGSGTNLRCLSGRS